MKKNGKAFVNYCKTKSNQIKKLFTILKNRNISLLNTLIFKNA